MATKVEIVNIALGLLSANLISSFTGDDSDEAELARLHYDAARDATLEAQEWTFARKRFIPQKNATPPLFGYGNAFDIPSEILRVVSCDRIDRSPGNFTPGDVIYQPEQVDWIVENRQILTNEEQLYARGIQRVTEEGKFSPLFVHAFAAKLAVLMALPLTQSATIATNMSGLYGAFIKEAKTRDGMQGRSRRIRQKSLLQSR